jgi:hypothetical protein
LTIEQAAKNRHARRAIEDAAFDCPAGCLDRQMPRLSACEQRDDLQQNGYPEHPRRGIGESGRELFAAPGKHEHEDRCGRKRAQDRDQRTSAPTEVAQAGYQLGQPTCASRLPRRAVRFVLRERHHGFRSAYRAAKALNLVGRVKQWSIQAFSVQGACLIDWRWTDDARVESWFVPLLPIAGDPGGCGTRPDFA